MASLLTIPGVKDGRLLGLVFDLALFALVYYYIHNGKNIHIRRVPALDAKKKRLVDVQRWGNPSSVPMDLEGSTIGLSQDYPFYRM